MIERRSSFRFFVRSLISQSSSELVIDTLFNDRTFIFIEEDLIDIFFKAVFLCHLFSHLCVDLRLRLLLIVLGDGLGVHDEAESEEIELGLTTTGNFSIAFIAPIKSPCVLDNPVRAFFFAIFPTDNFHDMAALESESVGSSRVNAIRVGKNISVWVQLGEHRTIRQNLLLNVLSLLGDAVVDNSVEVI